MNRFQHPLHALVLGVLLFVGEPGWAQAWQPGSLGRPVTAVALASAAPVAKRATSGQPGARPNGGATDPVTPLPARHAWAITLLAEPAKAWGTLPGYNGAAASETLNRSLTRGVRLERALGERWTARLGLGEARVEGRFNYDSTAIRQRLVSDTSMVTNVMVTTRVDTAWVVQNYMIPQISPILNPAGQIVGFDTIYVPRTDTIRQVIVSHDTVRNTKQTVTNRLETTRDHWRQQLRPEYRFWTIPISVQYDVLAWRRWRAGLSAGAQVVIFRGGQQPVWQGDHYELRRIGANDGPFRPVSLALTTALEVRYRLTDRLSLVGGGTVRGWAVNPVKTVTKVQLTPGALVGVSWGLGGN